VDALGEGTGLVRRLLASDVDAVDVPVAGLGAAVAASDLLLLEAAAVGPAGTAAVCVSGSMAAAATAAIHDVPVWLVAGVGRLLPARMWDALTARLDQLGDPWDLDDELVPLDLVTQVAGSEGVEDVPAALKRVDCPIAPELFRSVDPL
jgi:hypothetical protein